VATSAPQFVHELVELKTAEGAAETAAPAGTASKDDLYDQAVEIVIREGRGSVSLLQRALGIGYGRAARLVDFMAEDGIVGAYNGSQAREVMITLDQWQAMRGGSEGSKPDGGVPHPQQVLEAGRANGRVTGHAAPKILLPAHGDEADDEGPVADVKRPATPAAAPARPPRRRPTPPKPKPIVPATPPQKIVPPLEEDDELDDLDEAAPWEDDRQTAEEVEDWPDDDRPGRDAGRYVASTGHVDEEDQEFEGDEADDEADEEADVDPAAPEDDEEPRRGKGRRWNAESA